MTNQKNIKVSIPEDNIRIDRWFRKKFSSLTQNFIENKLRRGVIKVNQKKIKSNYRLTVNDIISINQFSEKLFPKKIQKKYKKNIPRQIYKRFYNSILFDSSDFMILEKWHGIASHSGSKIDISLDDIIKNISIDYNLVHRLDKDTSGLLIISKNYVSTKIFGKMFKNKEIDKFYLAICQGIPKNSNSIVKLEIKKKNIKQFSQSLTNYYLFHKINNISVLLFKPLTGKTHQLRIVSKHLNCPVIGDYKYNIGSHYMREQLMLNAIFLNFNFKGNQFTFVSSLPMHMIKFIKKMKLKTPKKDKLKNFLKTL